MSVPISSVPPFRPGMTQLDTAHLNAMLAACKQAATHNNTHGEIEWVETWLARIVTEGPAEEADYTDARYWVRRCRCSNTEGAQTVEPAFELVNTPMADKYEGYWVTATNFAEWQEGSHLLHVTTDPPSDPAHSPLVVIYTVYDRQAPPIKRYYFDRPPTVRLFAVRVWQDGGTTDGDDEEQCDRTYTVCTLSATNPDGTDGVQLGTAKTPERPRPTVGTLICPAADGDGQVGYGYSAFDPVTETTAFHLYDAGETLDAEALLLG